MSWPFSCQVDALTGSPSSSARRPGVAARRAAVCLATLALAWPALPAFGSKPRLRLERVDTSRCHSEGLVDVYLVDIELEGVLRQQPLTRYRLLADGKALGEPPSSATTFNRTKQPLHLALVIQATPSYEPFLEQIKAGLSDLLQSLPQTTETTVISYDWQPRRLVSHGTPRQVLQALDGVAVGADEVEPALDEALALGLRALDGQPAEKRRVLAVISDGINRLPKWDVFRGLGSRARAAGVTIHPVGFSPLDERGALLNLGEIAKRSGGTLRWAREPEQLRQEIGNLARELSVQQVLTFSVPSRCAQPHQLQVASGQLISNAVTTRAFAGQVSESGGSSLGLILFIGALLLALTGMTALVLVLLRPWRSKKPSAPRSKSRPRR